MASISLKGIPDDLHFSIKQLQLDREKAGKIISLNELYIELLKEAMGGKQAQEKK